MNPSFTCTRSSDTIPTSPDISGAIRVVAVVPTADEARREVERPSDVNGDKQSEYFWESARYYPEERGAGHVEP